MVSSTDRWAIEDPTGPFDSTETMSIFNVNSLEKLGDRPTRLTMSLNKQNSLFGNSETVHPESMRVSCLIRYK